MEGFNDTENDVNYILWPTEWDIMNIMSKFELLLWITAKVVGSSLGSFVAIYITVSSKSPLLPF